MKPLTEPCEARLHKRTASDLWDIFIIFNLLKYNSTDTIYCSVFAVDHENQPKVRVQFRQFDGNKL